MYYTAVPFGGLLHYSMSFLSRSCAAMRSPIALTPSRTGCPLVDTSMIIILSRHHCTKARYRAVDDNNITNAVRVLRTHSYMIYINIVPRITARVFCILRVCVCYCTVYYAVYNVVGLRETFAAGVSTSSTDARVRES